MFTMVTCSCQSYVCTDGLACTTH
uniref:Uncharacterized protein n=1 Tax=Arundo donax TaxID=35708 RepID=A0A0A8Z5A8_ARUDO